LRSLAVVAFGAGSALTAAVACSSNSSSEQLLPGTMDSGSGGGSVDSTTSSSSGGSSGGSSDDGGSGLDATLVTYDGRRLNVSRRSGERLQIMSAPIDMPERSMIQRRGTNIVVQLHEHALAGELPLPSLYGLA
jgi:hypothetical protein